MKVSYQWLQKYFDTALPEAQEVARLLTFHAFELESVGREGDDIVFDIKITPNRGHDALSHRGIAKELSAILNIPLARDPLATTPTLAPLSENLSITVDNSQLCLRYSAALIRGVEVKDSPLWLKKRLEAIGQRSINNIVDATNFVMFNLGQPLHAFDAGKLVEKKGIYAIEVRGAREGESLEALDGKRYRLKKGMLVIADKNADTPIGIAGVKGGRAAEIGTETKNIILESATFDGVSVRKTAQALKLRTDASSRFEQGLSPELAPYALGGVVEMILKIARGVCEGYADVYPHPSMQKSVTISLIQANALLGLAFSAEDIESIFKRLGFSCTRKGDTLTILPPFERLDLLIPEDLIEEVGRIYGYEHVPAIVPETKRADIVNKRFFYVDKIREILLVEGFSEILTSSFRASGDIAMENALASDKNHLRRDLRSNMEETLMRNARNQDLLGLGSIKAFEIGTVFTERKEHFSLALGIRSAEGKRQKKANDEVQNVITALEQRLVVPIPAEIREGIAEANLDKLIAALPDPVSYEKREETPRVRYRSFSQYPFIVRDIALWTSVGTESAAVEALLKKEAGELLVLIRQFDQFEKEGRVSYAFRLVFQAKDRTLTDEEINKIIEKVTTAIVSKGFEVR